MVAFGAARRWADVLMLFEEMESKGMSHSDGSYRYVEMEITDARTYLFLPLIYHGCYLVPFLSEHKHNKTI